MERYANMRGSFFAHYLKMKNSGRVVDKLASSQATRTKVANAVVNAKAVAKAKEEQLWKKAEENAFEYVNEVENMLI